jgi:hypothetical protein
MAIIWRARSSRPAHLPSEFRHDLFVHGDERVGEMRHDLGAFAKRRLTPGLPRGQCRFDGALDRGRLGIGPLGVDGAIHG